MLKIISPVAIILSSIFLTIHTPNSFASAKGYISIDGSSTVFPITEAVAEEYRNVNKKARVTVGMSGTGGGFKKFCRGEISISGASRPIKPTEIELCSKNQIDFIELPVAYDGIVVVVNKNNNWVDKMTVEELKKLWGPNAQKVIIKWNQVRPTWPDKEIHLFGAGVDSGTYDYFTAAIVGKEHSSRGDYTSSEDDNVLVQGVKTDPNSLGFFGYAYFWENKNDLKVVPISYQGKPPITPSFQTIEDGTYQPLSRPIFIYVSKKEANTRPEIKEFISFYLKTAPDLVKKVGYVPLPPKAYSLVTKRFEDRKVGSIFGGSGSKVGVTVEKLLSSN